MQHATCNSFISDTLSICLKGVVEGEVEGLFGVVDVVWGAGLVGADNVENVIAG